MGWFDRSTPVDAVEEIYELQAHLSAMLIRIDSKFSPSNERSCIEVNCAPEHSHLFFSKNDDEINKAKKLCGTCPSVRACLAQAMIVPSTEGVWGGLTREERLLIKK